VSQGGKVDYLIVDEAQFLAPEQLEVGYGVLCRRHHLRR
jgi:thymidine kinase